MLVIGGLGLAILLTVVLVVVLIPSLGMAAMAPMLADDPATANSVEVLIMVYSVFALPVVLLLAIGGVWLFFFLGLSTPATCLVSLLPLVNVGVFCAAMQSLRMRTS